MTEQFSAISFEQINKYQEYLSLNPSQASDYSFANIWGWAPFFGLEWRFDEHLCWIRQTKPYPCYWAPVGAWDKIDNWLSCPEFKPGAKFIRVPQGLCELWALALEGKAQISEARDQWDYLYLSEELATLSGNRFHKKRNLFKQFEKNYNYEYRPLSSECVETVLQMQDEWCRWRDCESSDVLVAENEAVARVLVRFNEIPGLCGGIIRVEGQPVAYTIAEPLNAETMIIHFEKACTEFKGAYQAINYLFCNDGGKNYKYINREQDLGDEGLRQAKLGYNPVDFARKCEMQII